jgi:hypothetical protein
MYRSNVGAKKTMTCTLASAAWVADGSTIPATETTRWGRTLQAGDFPSWSIPPASVVYIEKLVVSINNTSGSTQTISFKMYKNDSVVANNTQSSATGNYRCMSFNFYNVTIGDKLEVAIWTASNTNINVVGSLKHVVPTRLLPTSKPCIEVSYTLDIYSYPSPLTNIVNDGTRESIGNSIINSISSSTSRSFNGLSFVSQNSYGLFRYGDGDYAVSNSGTGNLHATLQKIDVSPHCTTVSYRELLT